MRAKPDKKIDIMEEWFTNNIGKFISGFIIVIIFAGGLIGYIYDGDKSEAAKDRKAMYNALTTEIRSRQAGDRYLKIEIETRLGISTFNEFKTSFRYVEKDVTEIKKDIKTILRNTN